MPVPRAPTDRFGDRVGDRLRHRPGYPEALPGWLHAHGVPARALVAGTDIVAGRSARMGQDAGHGRRHPVSDTGRAAGMAGRVVPDYATRAFIGTLD